MIQKNELEALLRDIESDRIERTEATKDADKFAQAVCAFANDMANHRLPGYLVIGVDDKNGEPVGINVTDKLLINLANLRSSGNIQPLPALNVCKMELHGKEIAVVEVFPSDLPPVRYKGAIWIRTGPRRAIANEQEERILTERRLSSAKTFDASPLSGSALPDISQSQFASYRQMVVAEEVIAANNRSFVEQLASLRLYDPARNCPTAAGILLFGKNPRYYLPGAYVQYLRFAGATSTEVPIDQAEISGDLLTVLRELDARLHTVVTTGMRPVSALREELVPDYPLAALREFLRNAVMHRDYQSNTPARFYVFSDRIEIQNPGGLYGEVTKETLMTRSGYRNPVLAEAMKAMGFVNRFGYGIQLAADALEKNGNPRPEFDIDSNVFLVKIGRRPA